MKSAENSTKEDSISLLTCGYVKVLDKCGTMTFGFGLKDSRTRISSSGRFMFITVIVILMNLIPLKDYAAGAASKESVMNYKMYAMKALDTWSEFSCLNYLWIKESNWNPKARNGSHYGIPQGRSLYLRTATPYQQIQWGLKYIRHRYGDACTAMDHSDNKGWY